MNRNITVALAAAAILGTAGGTYAAVQVANGDGNDPGPSAKPPSGSSPTPGKDDTAKPSDDSKPTDSPKPTPSEDTESTPAPDGLAAPLWITDTAIHDGDKTLQFSGIPEGVWSVERIEGGYLIANGTYDAESYGLYVVSEEDTYAQFVGFVSGTWDVNNEGNQVIGRENGKDRYAIWDLQSRKRVETVVPEVEGAPLTDASSGRAAFAGNDGHVVTEWLDGKVPIAVNTSRPSGDSGIVLRDVTEWAISDDGAWWAGNAPNTDLKNRPDQGVCATGGVFMSAGDGSEPWLNCDFRFYGRTAEISPNGKAALAVDALTDGFGPGGFDQLDLATGASLRGWSAPNMGKNPIYNGRFEDDNTITLMSAFDYDGNGTIIYSCSLGGDCTEVDRYEGDAVLGDSNR